MFVIYAAALFSIDINPDTVGVVAHTADTFALAEKWVTENEDTATEFGYLYRIEEA